ncbi:DHH family phosphoesterase [Nakamurella antarctica]|nr:bifunctional oligoribonuclease/PAP phosphatase NrnA [Nakamurella antarctica]
MTTAALTPEAEGSPVVHSAVSAVAAALRTAESVVLLAHSNPDADALGSALALGLHLRSRGTKVWVSFDRPAEIPLSLRTLPGQELIVTPSDLPVDAQLVVSVDVGARQRLGHLIDLFDAAPVSICIDHHASNPGFGQIQLIDPSAAANVMLVVEVLDEMQAEITADIAANLYAGLATDTANFRFATAPSHLLAARLIAAGTEPQSLMRPIMDTHPFRWLAMLSCALKSATLLPEVAHGAGMVWVKVSEADSDGLRMEDLDSIIDIVRTTGEAEIAAVFKETAPLMWQVSLRAKTTFDVGRAATELGGGGHPRSAGYSFSGNVESLLAELMSVLQSVEPAR